MDKESGVKDAGEEEAMEEVDLSAARQRTLFQTAFLETEANIDEVVGNFVDEVLREVMERVEESIVEKKDPVIDNPSDVEEIIPKKRAMTEASYSKVFTTIQIKDIQNVLGHFSKTTYKSGEPQNPFEQEAMTRCLELFRVDYSVLVISNALGDLSAHYPSYLPILEYEHTSPRGAQHNTIYEHLLDVHKLRELMQKARTARCRTRFAVPVISYKGKFVCRSGTLSGGPEIYGRSGLDYLFSSDSPQEPDEPPESYVKFEPAEWALFDKVRNNDIKLLNALNVGTIVDFMVEKKKVKFGLNVTSSEKVDKERRYSDFNLVSLPYPGCEFFKLYRDHDYEPVGLHFDWSPAYVDASISIPNDPIAQSMSIDWPEYKSWDLAQLTQNYLKLLLRYLQESNNGLLIHCISGWDRTPLFTSLIRLSLWADGLIHHNLDAQQILYLTVTYDWMLFGHHLSDRLSKGEEIFFFCFHSLKHYTGEEYSVQGPGRFKTRIDRPAEKPVRADPDGQLDGSLLLDKEIAGSNISLNSTSSSVSNKSQEFPPMFANQSQADIDNIFNSSGSPASINDMPSTSNARSPLSRRTSPVTVPATKLRTRQESVSSVSMGSWHMITGAGSVRDSDASDSNGITASSEHGSTDPANTTDDDPTTYLVDGYKYRKRRLLKVRELFLNSYASVIGLPMKGDTAFGSLLVNIAEKVGLSTSRT